MQIDDTVICVDADSSSQLTLGKKYIIADKTQYLVYVVNNNDDMAAYGAFRFKVCNREKKLKRILK